MAKCKDCHCKCHCNEVLHSHWYDGDLCACDKCNCKRTYEFAKDHSSDISFENEVKRQ
jgi:hypothetical protein